MHLFAPDRPTVGQGKPALACGSAVPIVTVIPLASGQVQLSLMLKNFDTAANFSYSYRNTTLALAYLQEFFAAYMEDPEATLSFYFDWKATLRAPANTHQRKHTQTAPNVHDLF